MNYMYDMNIDIHLLGTFALIAYFIYNYVMLKNSIEPYAYISKIRKALPIGYSLLFLMLYTGATMMAAKHLQFSVENIIMIIIGLVLILLEINRFYSFKSINPKKDGIFEEYRKRAYQIMFIEFALTLSITLWMVI
ncbi:MAG: hypothetical protein GQ570_07755 [Helicobacteraceae bacterium]|nr:hypothetical protein [Helicobacteraceae bacterium]